MLALRRFLSSGRCCVPRETYAFGLQNIIHSLKTGRTSSPVRYSSCSRRLSFTVGQTPTIHVPQQFLHRSGPQYLICKRAPVAFFHTSSPRRAPQILLMLLAPVSRFFVAIGGRLTRSWWSRLTPERRDAIKSSIRKNRKYFYWLFGGLTLGGVGFYMSHLEETPLTRRKRFIMFRREEIHSMIQNEKESILEMVCSDKSSLLPHSHTVYQRVHKIVSRILASNNSPEFEGFDWALYVIDRPNSVNALCLPTGDIFVYTGLVNQCKNDDELAFILSHEMAHAVLGHGVEALSRSGVISFIQLFLIAVIWAVIPSDLVSYFMHSLSKSSVQVMLGYPHSRRMETEADKVSLSLSHTHTHTHTHTPPFPTPQLPSTITSQPKFCDPPTLCRLV